MMLRFSVMLLLLTCSRPCFAQYYYTDLISTDQSARQYKALKANQVKSMSARSFESDNEAAAGFTLSQQISADFSQITTTTSYPSTGNSVTRSSYRSGRLQQSTDSSENVVTTTTYSYLPESRIGSITAVTRSRNAAEATGSYNSEELHQWQYGADGRPVQMLKIKDKKDTTVVTFIQDEQGNIGEERWSRAGKRTETYYYYYNQQKQLTDIVRYSIKAKRLLPEYLFEYDKTGRVLQMTQIPVGSSNYLVWKYEFTPEGLKQKDLCYNKHNQPVGTVVYSYKF